MAPWVRWLLEHSLLEGLITDDHLHSSHLVLLVELDDCQHSEELCKGEGGIIHHCRGDRR